MLRELFEDRKKRRQREKLVVGAKSVAVGSIVGATLGLLFAPKSGKETREDIVIGAMEAKDKAAEKATLLKEDVQLKAEELKVSAQDTVEKLSKKTDEVIRNLKNDNLLDDLRDKAEDYVEEAQDAFEEGKDKVKDMADDVAKKAKDVKDKAEDAIDDVAKKAKNIKDDVKDKAEEVIEDTVCSLDDGVCEVKDEKKS